MKIRRPAATRRRFVQGAGALAVVGFAPSVLRAQGQPITLGILTPLTGAGGADGPRMEKAMKLVFAEANAAGGVLGKKVGEGFYAYRDGVAVVPPEPTVPRVDSMPPVWVSPKAARRAQLYQLLKNLGASIETAQAPSTTALILVAPLGLDVTTLAAVERLDPTRTLGIDMMLEDAATGRRVMATNPATRPDMRDAAQALLARDGKPVSVVRDSGGFVTQRVVATIVNIAADMCQQGICTPKDLETAVTLGLGYPMGPLAMGDLIGPANVLEILFNMGTVYGDPRYRPSPWLRRRGALPPLGAPGAPRRARRAPGGAGTRRRRLIAERNIRRRQAGVGS